MRKSADHIIQNTSFFPARRSKILVVEDHYWYELMVPQKSLRLRELSLECISLVNCRTKVRLVALDLTEAWHQLVINSREKKKKIANIAKSL